MNKRGLAASFIVGIMITLIAFVLISGTLMRFMSKGDDLEAEILCQSSIALRAQTALYYRGDLASADVKVVPPLCKTIDKKIRGNRDQIMRQVADSTARCWWMFNEGRYEEIINREGTSGLIDMLGFSKLEGDCFNCYTLLIDQDEIEGGPITSDDITEFMTTQKYYKVNQTYLNYIQSYGGPGRIVFTAPAILPLEAYSVSMMPKNKDASDFWGSVTQGLIGTVVAVGVGVAVLCIGFTFGACTAPAGAIGAFATAATHVGLLVIASPTIAGGIAGTVVAASTYMAVDGYMDAMTNFYGERDVSSIYVGFLKVGEQMCGSGDIAGN